MKTFQDYQTATPEDGQAILSRVLDALLDSPDCFYQTRSASFVDAIHGANWQARTDVLRLRKAISPADQQTLFVDAQNVTDVDSLSLAELDRLTSPVQEQN